METASDFRVLASGYQDSAFMQGAGELRHAISQPNIWQAEFMARGWESKEVEMQIESAQERLQHSRMPVRTAEQIAFEREQESIELSRRRVLEDMAAASNPKYRELLQRSLDFLDTKLARLKEGGEPERQNRAIGS